MVASPNGHLEVVRQLIEAGADKNLATTGTESPLYIATEGHVEVVRFLLEAGSDKNQAADTGALPLDVAFGAIWK